MKQILITTLVVIIPTASFFLLWIRKIKNDHASREKTRKDTHGFLRLLLEKDAKIYPLANASILPVKVFLDANFDFVNNAIKESSGFWNIVNLGDITSYGLERQISDRAKRFLSSGLVLGSSTISGRSKELAYVLKKEAEYKELASSDERYKWLFNYIGITQDFFSKLVDKVTLRDISISMEPNENREIFEWMQGQNIINIFRQNPRAINAFKNYSGGLGVDRWKQKVMRLVGVSIFGSTDRYTEELIEEQNKDREFILENFGYTKDNFCHDLSVLIENAIKEKLNIFDYPAENIQISFGQDNDLVFSTDGRKLGDEYIHKLELPKMYAGYKLCSSEIIAATT